MREPGRVGRGSMMPEEKKHQCVRYEFKAVLGADVENLAKIPQLIGYIEELGGEVLEEKMEVVDCG